MKPSLLGSIHYEISLAALNAHDTSHLRSFIAALSSLDGPELAAFQGCLHISADPLITGQPFNHPDVRAYFTGLAETPLGLSFFLQADSKSLHMAAYSVASRVETYENERTGDLAVTFSTEEIVRFLSADLLIAERLFTQSGLGEPAFENCITTITRQFNLSREDF